jgi:hypothetical protein|tara:strand:+ start:40 stop:177 length:138 start_codon:yes stop_codon:yes gene_type:complete
MEGLNLYKGLPGIQVKSDKTSDYNCMKPVTKRIKESKGGTQLKNK